MSFRRPLLLCVAGLTVGCYDSREGEPAGELADVREQQPPAPDYPRADALHAGAPPVCGADGEGCRFDVDDCDGTFASGPLPPPWWSVEPVAECVRESRHELLEYLDDCVVNGVPAEHCGAQRGDAVCGGWVTTLCRAHADCPTGMACAVGTELVEAVSHNFVWGACVKRCDPSGSPAECVRCDSSCTSQGICLTAAADFR